MENNWQDRFCEGCKKTCFPKEICHRYSVAQKEISSRDARIAELEKENDIPESVDRIFIQVGGNHGKATLCKIYRFQEKKIQELEAALEKRKPVLRWQGHALFLNDQQIGEIFHGNDMCNWVWKLFGVSGFKSSGSIAHDFLESAAREWLKKAGLCQ